MLSTMGIWTQLSLTILIWMTVGVHDANPTACSPGWYNWRDSCYIALKEKLTWFDALTACQRLGGSLLLPNSREEHKFIMKIRNQAFSEFRNRPLWIGCDIVNNNLRCVGEQSENNVYTNWYSGHPKKSGHFCVSKGGWGDGYQKSESCTINKFAICEMPRLASTYCTSLRPDGRMARWCLHGYEIKNVTVKAVSECGQACWAEPQCRSFNLWQGGLAKTCQLNRATRNEVSSDAFCEQGLCTYFDLEESC
ncbi:snaclec stejaggregin-A subunit beta-3-like [Acanthaster planci]|uniref:Snaclec stejaggregin-A subunit beta-3-like n=1 Tax=Acanthaster planci TaxID=133434 RepID=A0A8B7ZTL9_ACAPL|nr:snaclec stejaggregin-A subunit beta-3-like [Acanthaster planci]